MREDFDPSYEENDNRDKLVKLEDMFSNTAYHYFDVNEWESLIEYYLSLLKIDKAQKALQLAQHQHPYSDELKLKSAELCLEQNNPDRALPILKKLETRYPSNSEILTLQAEALSKRNDHYGSISIYKRALKLDDADKEHIYGQLAAECQSLEKTAQSIYWLKVLLNDFPESIEGLYEITFCYEINEQQQEGIAFFTDYLSKHPYNHHAWFNLGNIHTTLEEFDQALSAFDYSVVSFEEFASGWYNKGNILGRLERYSEAIEAFEKTLEYEGPSAQTYYFIGDCYENLENYSLAKDAYKKALEQDQNHYDSCIGLAGCYLELGDPSEALIHCEIALKNGPEKSITQHLYGDICKALGYNQAAKCAYENVITTSPDNWEVFLDLSDLLFCNEEKDQALDILEEALIVFPENSELFYRLGTYYYLTGSLSNAFENWQTAYVLNPELKRTVFEYCPQLSTDTTVVDFFD